MCRTRCEVLDNCLEPFPGCDPTLQIVREETCRLLDVTHDKCPEKLLVSRLGPQTFYCVDESVCQNAALVCSDDIQVRILKDPTANKTLAHTGDMERKDGKVSLSERGWNLTFNSLFSQIWGLEKNVFDLKKLVESQEKTIENQKDVMLLMREVVKNATLRMNETLVENRKALANLTESRELSHVEELEKMGENISLVQNATNASRVKMNQF